MRRNDNFKACAREVLTEELSGGESCGGGRGEDGTRVQSGIKGSKLPKVNLVSLACT